MVRELVGIPVDPDELIINSNAEEIFNLCTKGDIQNIGDLRNNQFATLVRWFANKIPNPAAPGQQPNAFRSDLVVRVDDLRWDQKKLFDGLPDSISKAVLDKLSMVWFSLTPLHQVLSDILTQPVAAQEPEIIIGESFPAAESTPLQQPAAISENTPAVVIPQSVTATSHEEVIANALVGAVSEGRELTKREINRLAREYVTAFNPLVNIFSFFYEYESYRYGQRSEDDSGLSIKAYLRSDLNKQTTSSFIFLMFAENGGKLEYNSEAYDYFIRVVLNQLPINIFVNDPYRRLNTSDQKSALQFSRVLDKTQAEEALIHVLHQFGNYVALNQSNVFSLENLDGYIECLSPSLAARLRAAINMGLKSGA